MPVPATHNMSSTDSFFTLQYYVLTSEINDLIVNKIQDLMKRYGKIEYSDVIISSIKELIYNASKANLKRAFFKDKGLDIHDMGSYARGLPEFKELIGTRDMAGYFERFAPMDLWSRFSVEHSPLGIRLEVSNHTSIIPIEEKRIRMKLALAMSREDILDFYNQVRDQSEGAGLGIALVINLLRSIGVDPGYFRIGTTGSVTNARIEVPFSPEYQFLRRKNFTDSGIL